MKFFRTDCREAMDEFYKRSDDEAGLFYKPGTGLHLLICPRCAEERRLYKICKDLLRSGFFPPSPSLEEKIMEQLPEERQEEFTDVFHEVPGGFSFRTWVIIGFFILVSLTSSFFGMDFITLASKHGSSILVPLGITIGITLTGYGAFFIGSHLRELTDHFKLNIK